MPLEVVERRGNVSCYQLANGSFVSIVQINALYLCIKVSNNRRKFQDFGVL
jgi:hypothetical protein